MQEAGEACRGPAAQHKFAGVDLRRPKGYAAAPAAAGADGEGEPCPRCASRDTKFCYYNNYNTSQPRHFCKGCRRYWTKGGTLRNVPVGGGTRKRPSPSSPPSSYTAADKPKRKPAGKKRRVEAPPPPAEPAKPTIDDSTKVKTEGASDITAELVVPAAAEEEDSLAHLLRQPETDDAEAVALGLGLSDFPAGKGLLDVAALEPDSFEWPAAFDLGACWGSAGFVDPDPAGLFLNLP